MCTLSCRVFTVVLAHDSFELPFFFLYFFYPVWQLVDTRTHLRMLELWTILISPGLTDWDIPQVYLVLYFLFPFMLTEDSDVFVVYFFLCRLSVWCLFFCYQWPKSCSPFIHTWQMWVVCLSMCRVPEFFLQISCWYHHWMS